MLVSRPGLHAVFLVTFLAGFQETMIVMTMVFNRIVELVGWIVLGVCVLLLIAAHHIDNYQTPEAPATATTPHK